jgi:3-oxoacyl-[acyl-carrier protein] reductase
MGTGLEDKVALVTGASRGIGAAAARALASEGARVVVNYLASARKAGEVVDEIKRAGGKAMAVQADVRDRRAVDKMVEQALKEWGKIDILVNNASIGFPMKPFTELSWEEIEAKLVGEIKALYNCSQAVLGDMLKRKSGKLIFISSGLSRRPGYGFSAHSSAKAAMDGMARVMALELGPMGITVNVVGPGLTMTDATSGLPEEAFRMSAQAAALKRVGMPDDIAGAVVFLASSLSDYLTGQYIAVDGGSLMV